MIVTLKFYYQASKWTATFLGFAKSLLTLSSFTVVTSVSSSSLMSPFPRFRHPLGHTYLDLQPHFLVRFTRPLSQPQNEHISFERGSISIARSSAVADLQARPPDPDPYCLWLLQVPLHAHILLPLQSSSWFTFGRILVLQYTALIVVVAAQTRTLSGHLKGPPASATWHSGPTNNHYSSQLFSSSLMQYADCLSYTSSILFKGHFPNGLYSIARVSHIIQSPV